MSAKEDFLGMEHRQGLALPQITPGAPGELANFGCKIY
jgi:hypothetical protein